MRGAVQIRVHSNQREAVGCLNLSQNISFQKVRCFRQQNVLQAMKGSPGIGKPCRTSNYKYL
jgi:hypothetical protein